MDDEDVQDDELGSTQANGSKKPETEEEKRRNFLERNRQGMWHLTSFLYLHCSKKIAAALKCRQRKKAWLAQLQAKVEFLQNENDRLTNALVSSREEISRLNALLGTQAPVAVSSVNSQPVSVAVSLPGAAKSVPAPVSVSNGRGYGY
jgi:ATF/CREB family transcription factor